MRAISHQRVLSSIVMLCIVSLMLVTTVTIFTATDLLRQQIVANAAQRIDSNLQVFWHLLRERGSPLHLVDGRLYAGEARLDSNVTFVDELRSLVGGEAAIFLNREMIALTPPLPEPSDGSRSQESTLMPSTVSKTVLTDGRSYRGVIDIQGRSHFAGYDPIKTSDGTVIGALFVGFDEANFMAGLQHMRMIMLCTSLIGLVAVGLVFTLLANSLGRKLRDREVSLARANRLLDTALESMKQGLCFIGADQKLIIGNRRYAEIYQLNPEALKPGTSFQQIAEWRRKAGTAPRDLERHAQDINNYMQLGTHPGNLVTELANGQVIAVHFRHMPDGAWVATHDDITERRKDEARIAYLARHDSLTGLSNRLLFRESLTQALTAKDETLAILCLDLDHFKTVNETLGHPVGDRLLQCVAARIAACLSERDTLARLGGDEFAIIHRHLSGADDAAFLARRVLEAIAAPYDIDGRRIQTETSIGIAMAPGDATETEDLLRLASTALNQAKADGRATLRFYETGMNTEIQLRRSLELDLRLAVERQQLMLFYQPMLDITSSEVIGLEALLRWQHPTRGMISPADFIPLAEETGLIIPIGAWVIRQACIEASGWPGNVRVSVNVSPVQFKGDRLVDSVVQALKESGLAPDRLELEITESLLLQNNDINLSILNALSALGVRVALDDFGTGYASLGYLRSFRFDTLKIDQSFVRDLSDDGDCLTIVRAITGLGRSLGLRVLAEGVETGPQLDTLRQAGCHSAQGYLFSRPRPAEEVLALLAQRSAA